MGVFLNVSIYMFGMIAGNYTEGRRRDLGAEVLGNIIYLNLYLCKTLGGGRKDNGSLLPDSG